MDKKQCIQERLFEACLHGELSEVREALKQGADIQAEENKALSHAAMMKHNKLVKYLLTSPELEIHSDIHYEENSLLTRTSNSGNLELVHYLLTSPDLKENCNVHIHNDLVLRQAAINGDLEMLEYYLTDPKLKGEFYVNKKYEFQGKLITLIQMAATHNKLDVVKFLTTSNKLQIHADINDIQKEDTFPGVWQWVEEFKECRRVEQEVKDLDTANEVPRKIKIL